MSKLNSQDLFQLIKSLSKAEKRYFRLFAARHTIGEKNKYLLLFSLIDDQKEYDEESIIRSQAFGKKQLSDLKNYLYKLILKSMLAFHSDGSLPSSLNGMIRQIGILLEKGLYVQCEKLLARARKLGYRHEKYRELVEIIALEKRWLDGVSYGGKKQKDIYALYEEENTLQDKIRAVNEAWRFYALTFHYTVTEGHIRSKGEQARFDKLATGPTRNKDMRNAPFEESNYHYFAHELSGFARQDWHSMYQWCIRHLHAIEKKLPVGEDKINPYIGLLDNLILACTRLKKYDEALACIKKIRALSHRSVYTQVRIFVRSEMQELILHTTTRNFEKGIALVPGIVNGLTKYKDKVNKEMQTLFYYHIFHLYFLAKDYSPALKWLNRILNDTHISSREDIRCIARIVNLILHYEIGNMHLLQHITKSSSHFLSRKHRLYEFEKMVLTLIKKLARTDDKPRQQQLLQSFIADLKTASPDLSAETAFEYFDFLAWAEGKIRG